MYSIKNLIMCSYWGICITTNLVLALQCSAASVCVLAFTFIVLYRMGFVLNHNFLQISEKKLRVMLSF